jgi:hypothetical protein
MPRLGARLGANSVTFELTATYIQCQRCSRLERFFIGEKNIFILKCAMLLVFYDAGVVTRDRRIGSCDRELQSQHCKNLQRNE